MLGTFKLRKQASRPRAKTRTIRAEKLKDPADTPPFFIRGIKAGSKEELWVSLALEKIEITTGWTWEYQIPIYGGRQLAGGQVVDFLVQTPGRPTVLDPMGKYWHTGKHEDRQTLPNLCRRKNWNYVGWFTDETPTKEIMYSFIRNKLNA